MYFKSHITPVKVVGIMCQLYVWLFSGLSLIISLYVTIPSLRSLKDNAAQSEHSILSGLEVIFVFLLCLTIANYSLLKYNASFSSFSYEELKTTPVGLSTADIFKPTVTLHNFDHIWSSRDAPDNNITSNEQDTFCINVNASCSNSFLISSNNKDKASNKIFKGSKTEIAVNSKLELDTICCNSNELSPETKSNGIKTLPKVTVEWYFCKYCKKIAPPRSKHCPLCNVCVLKRDHHCFFADCCIGFHNQRYFITFCFYAILCTLFSTIATSFYLKQYYTHFQIWGYMSYLPPVIAYFWCFDSLNNHVLAMLIFQYFNIVTTLCCVYYCITQIYLVCSGQTMYEYLKGIQTFRGNFWENVYSVFGRYWFLSFFIPLPCHGLISDGINWNGYINNKCL